jgi:recombination and repair protein|nr:MAG TPA: Recombination and repair protein [Caudoviricetes sp.]
MSDLLNKLKASTKNKLVNVLSESDVFNVKDCATTPIPALNLILSGDVLGGLPTGITTIAAPSAHFKTILGLFMVASYMRKYDDAVCIFYDSEGGVTQQTFESMGVSADRILHVPVSDIGQLRTEITNHLININRGDHVIIFIDSIGMLPSLKEVSDAEDGKNVADMTRAKDMGSLFRIMNAKSVVLNIPIVVINAVYQTLEMYSKTEMKGGCVDGDTNIVTRRGFVPMKEVLVGDEVLTHTNDWKPVTHTWTPETLDEGNPECYEVEFEDGSRVICSYRHKFLTENGWQPITNLSEGQTIL